MGSITTNNLKSEAADVLSAARRPMSLISEKFHPQQVARVEGELIAVNDSIVPDLPLRAGKISFFVAWRGNNAEMELNGLSRHGRVLSFNIRFRDKYGNEYDYVSIKGGGITAQSTEASYNNSVYNSPHDDEGVRGLEWSLDALADWVESNHLLEHGARTTVPIALIQLKSIVMADGTKKSVEEAVSEGILPVNKMYDYEFRKFVPVLYIRGFREIMRVLDADAVDFEAFAAERGLSRKEYARLWSKEVARNVAILHDLGKVHTYLNDHNITLDGGIVDLDSVEDASFKKIEGDLLELLSVIDTFSKLNINHSLFHEFMREYFSQRKNMSKEEKGEWMADLGTHIPPSLFRARLGPKIADELIKLLLCPDGDLGSKESGAITEPVRAASTPT
jgi:hypothetical protein